MFPGFFRESIVMSVKHCTVFCCCSCFTFFFVSQAVVVGCLWRKLRIQHKKGEKYVLLARNTREEVRVETILVHV